MQVSLGLLVSALMGLIQEGAGLFEERLVDKCCLLGTEFAESSGYCNRFPSSIVPRGSDLAEEEVCRSLIEVCCLQATYKGKCKDGVDTALDTGTCDRLQVYAPVEENTYKKQKECCQCCQMGREAGERSLPCTSMDDQSEICEESPECCTSFKTCCRRSTPAPASTTTVEPRGHRPGGMCDLHADLLCEHTCVDTDVETGFNCTCNPGYRLHFNGRNCDIVERPTPSKTCERDSPCDRTAECYEQEGVLLCRCSKGYELVDRNRCEDIDECSIGMDECVGGTCRNTAGSYECSIQVQCDPGFQTAINPLTNFLVCVDINECTLRLDDCASRRLSCRNTNGSYVCERPPRQCSSGFLYDELSRSCVDVNECLTGRHGCLSEGLCVNTRGSFYCQKCDMGYSFDETSLNCLDIDECSLRLDNCQSRRGEVCRNTNGSYVCNRVRRCSQGYQRNIRTGVCEDIDECFLRLDNCQSSRGEICRNSNGSYVCDRVRRCSQGLQRNVRTGLCEDIDECSLRLDNCRSSQAEICRNTNGSYVCDRVRRCSQGFQRNVRTGLCEDIDECFLRLDNCQSSREEVCRNINGSYVCDRVLRCSQGFQRNIRTGLCEDVDECSLRLDNCRSSKGEICRNTNGSYICDRERTCSQGFLRNPRTGLCEDIDECSLRLDNCQSSREEVCRNTNGSYVCDRESPKCSPGYQHSSRSGVCEDLDECVMRTHRCTSESQCVNTVGSFYCRSCNAGFVFNSIKGFCEDIDECTTGRSDCRQGYRCKNTYGSFSCNLSQRCSQGLAFNFTTQSCKDINECETGAAVCGTGDSCINTYGGYGCTRSTQCRRGLQYNVLTRRCDDVDECSTGTHRCGRAYTCVNTLGSYKCTFIRCGSGFRYNLVKGICDDIDECMQARDNCRPDLGEMCMNTPGSFSCECPPGFALGRFGKCEVSTTPETTTAEPETGAQVADPCAAGQHDCGKAFDCITIEESFGCRLKKCSSGYRLNRSNGRCERPSCRSGHSWDPRILLCTDVNECLRNSSICGTGFRCQNTRGSYTCQRKTCPAGVEMSLLKIDCLEASATAVSGSGCPQGYKTGEFATDLCIDVNECREKDMEACDVAHECVNRPGSFDCRLKTCPDELTLDRSTGLCGCNSGFTRNTESGRCEDVDECKTGKDECRLGFVCTNTLGSFSCSAKKCSGSAEVFSPLTGLCETIRCRRGYSPNIFTRRCDDIDECLLKGSCPADSVCINRPGSYHCRRMLVCDKGYALNRAQTACLDVDECFQGLHNCSSSQQCANKLGTYVCLCAQGYERDPVTKQCEDLNECEKYPNRFCSLQSATCENTIGSYKCTCRPGFQSVDFRSCEDINECALEGRCEQKCINTYGGYQCSCGPGFVLSEDGHTCSDVDECALAKGRGEYACYGLCRNSPGSFECSCPPGYTLDDGNICQDINECSFPDRSGCLGPGQMCVNLRGKHTCETIQCPRHYNVTDAGESRPNSLRCTFDRASCSKDTDLSCLSGPAAISHSFVVLNPYRLIDFPLVIFRIGAPDGYTMTSRLRLLEVTATSPHSVPATEDQFLVTSEDQKRVAVKFSRPVIGPQRIILEVTLLFVFNSGATMNSVEKVHLYVEADPWEVETKGRGKGLPGLQHR